jgi:hypothetical protein
MMPATFGLPAAMLLGLGGALACFAGYRLFRVVLALVGLVLGARAGASMADGALTTPVVGTVVWLLGGLAGAVVGAALLSVAYFVGVALVGSVLGALLAHLVFSFVERNPGMAVIVVFSVAGAAASIYFERWVVVAVTAFAGAWALLLGVRVLFGMPLVLTSGGPWWLPVPAGPLPGAASGWTAVAWVVLAITGVAGQIVDGRRKAGKRASREEVASQETLASHEAEKQGRRDVGE